MLNATPDVAVAGAVMLNDAAGPGTRFTVALCVIATPSRGPLTVAVPATVPLSAAEYVPLPLFDGAVSDPRSLLRTRLSEPEVMSAPFASFRRTVIVDADVPFATIVVGTAVRVELTGDAPTLMLAVEMIAD